MERIRPENIEKHFKPSRYNFFIKYTDGNYYGYNFFYRTIIRIPSHIFNSVRQLLSEKMLTHLADKSICYNEEVSDKTIQALRNARFLIEKDLDELNLIKFRYFRNLYANDFLSIIILPTFDCNFSCPYCFEYKTPTVMSLAVEKALGGWVEKHFNKIRRLHVSWFGGEPLLEKDIIIRLSERFQLFCKKIIANYQSSITTNGYFLDAQFQKNLGTVGVKLVQITLDGDKDTHDRYRKLKNGTGSFEQIYSNILYFCENVKDCKLILRVNCGNDNYSTIEKLLERFPAIVRSRVSLFFRWIWTNEASNYKDFSGVVRGNIPYEGLSKLYKAAKTIGWNTRNPLDRISDGYCEVDNLNHFQITPDGNLFLCNHTYKASDAVSNILNKNIINSKYLNYYASWYSANPFNDQKCVECTILPICSGGCRKARLHGKRSCIEEVESIESYVYNLINERVNLVEKV